MAETRFPADHRHPTDGEYEVMKHNLMVGGVLLRKGDRLPAESPLRRQPRRLEQLCQQRRLRPVVEHVKLGSETPKEEPKRAEIVRLCKGLGIPTKGKSADLLRSLRSKGVAI